MLVLGYAVAHDPCYSLGFAHLVPIEQPTSYFLTVGFREPARFGVHVTRTVHRLSFVAFRSDQHPKEVVEKDYAVLGKSSHG